ncbi:MAG: KilA-N domain-containing protein [Bacteroidia bacterium]
MAGLSAHPDIAFDFGAWISPRFRYLLYREFQRLEREEAMA